MASYTRTITTTTPEGSVVVSFDASAFFGVEPKTKVIEGKSIQRGLPRPEDKGMAPEPLAMARWFRKMAKEGFTVAEDTNGQPVIVEPEAMLVFEKTGNVEDLLTMEFVDSRVTVREESKAGPKGKSKLIIPVRKPEGAITAANIATKTDCGLATPATNRPAFVASANAAIQTVDAVSAILAEEGLEVSGQRADVNRLMESGAAGEKALGAYRQDSNGAPIIQQVRAEVVDPSVRPFEARAQASVPSINARKGVAPLVSRPVVSGAWAADKAQSKRKAQGTAERSELDPIANELGRLFANPANLMFTFGNGTDLESIKLGRAMLESLKVRGDESLNKRLVGQVAWRLGFLVGCARQGIMPTSPCNGFVVALLQFGINFSQDADGKPVVNGRPVTWDLELAGTAGKAVNE